MTLETSRNMINETLRSPITMTRIKNMITFSFEQITKQALQVSIIWVLIKCQRLAIMKVCSKLHRI